MRYAERFTTDLRKKKIGSTCATLREAAKKVGIKKIGCFDENMKVRSKTERRSGRTCGKYERRLQLMPYGYVEKKAVRHIALWKIRKTVRLSWQADVLAW